jgi:hypothetical protein
MTDQNAFNSLITTLSELTIVMQNAQTNQTTNQQETSSITTTNNNTNNNSILKVIFK